MNALHRIVFALGLVILCAGTAQAQLAFITARDQSTPVIPLNVAIADVNGDGKLDLITTGPYRGITSPPMVSVQFGNGDGTFQAPVLYSGAADGQIVVGDFNGDGKPDLIVLGEYYSPVFLNNGDGTFHLGGDVATSAYPTRAVSGDFNHDGKPDLAIVNSMLGTVTVFLGNGDGTFTQGQALPCNQPTSAVSGDFNHDGNLDLCVAENSAAGGHRLAQILLGNGDGTFRSGGLYDLGRAFNAQTGPSVAADFHHTGNLDLALAVGQGTVCVLTGQGDGTFQVGPMIVTGIECDHLAAVDLNNDGYLDLVAGNTASGAISVLLNRHDGTFLPHRDYSGAALLSDIAVGDVNGDGAQDIVTGEYGTAESMVHVLLGNADGSLRAAPSQPIGTRSEPLLLADFTGTGRVGPLGGESDLQSAYGPDLVMPFAGEGNGFFDPVGQVLDPAGMQTVIGVGDITGNGKSDLLVFSGVPGIRLGNGDGTFQPFRSLPNPSSNFQCLAFGDFNGDGKMDLAIAGQSMNALSVYLGNGDGSFQPPLASAPVQIQAMAAGDFNGDGKLDLLTWNFSGVTLLCGNGDGTFALKTSMSFPSNVYDVATGDFNGDGKLDFAIADGQGVTVLLGNGNGTFQPPVRYDGQMTSWKIVTADFDGDGHLDLAISDRSTDAVRVYRGNGDGTFESPVSVLSGDYPYQLAVGDFNGDGRSDLAVEDYYGQTLTVLLSTPIPIVTGFSPASQTVGTRSFILTVAGQNFVQGAVVLWNGMPLSTTYDTSAQLTAAVPAALASSAGSATVSVTNPFYGQTGTAKTSFLITPPALTLSVVSAIRYVLKNGLICSAALQNQSATSLNMLRITQLTLGGVPTKTLLPIAAGDLAADGALHLQFVFPVSVGTTGAVKTLTISGSYVGGTFIQSTSLVLP